MSTREVRNTDAIGWLASKGRRKVESPASTGWSCNAGPISQHEGKKVVDCLAIPPFGEKTSGVKEEHWMS